MINSTRTTPPATGAEEEYTLRRAILANDAARARSREELSHCTCPPLNSWSWMGVPSGAAMKKNRDTDAQVIGRWHDQYASTVDRGALSPLMSLLMEAVSAKCRAHPGTLRTTLARPVRHDRALIGRPCRTRFRRPGEREELRSVAHGRRVLVVVLLSPPRCGRLCPSR